MSRLEVVLLGVPEARKDGAPLKFRIRKALALLAYLAVEPGPHSRDKLADLLWEGPSIRVHSAFRAALHYLQTSLGPEFPLSTTRYSVDLPRDDRIWVDVLALEGEASGRNAAPDPSSVALRHGEFLEGLSVHAPPEWDEWVGARRQTCSGQLDQLWFRLAHVQLEAGELQAAIRTARRRVSHDPLNEEAYSQLIRAQRAAGLHADAYETQRHCRDTLQRELGVAAVVGPPPSLLLTSQTLSSPAPPRDGPPLVGRAGLLAQMEEALETNKVVFLAGEAGVGKSHLAETFLARQNLDYFTVVAQENDADLPFSMQARTIRACLSFLGHPEIPVALRQQLSRIVPELWDSAPAFVSAADRLLFYDAYVDLIAQVCPPQLTVLHENHHHWDRESHHLGLYASLHGPSRGAFVRALLTYRPERLPGYLADTLKAVVDLDRAVIIEVPPLSVDQVHELLASIEPRVTAALAGHLHHFTGGNPLFVWETARLLQERGGLTHPDYRELPRSPRVSGVIGQRLARLSKGARDVVRVAALAGPEFSFGVAARVLTADELSVAAALEELETAGLFRGEHFAHDLLKTTVLDLTSGPARAVIHRRLLDALRGTSVAPATLARHALGGQRWREAHDLLVQASQEARRLLANTEAESLAAQARLLLNTHGGHWTT